MMVLQVFTSLAVIVNLWLLSRKKAEGWIVGMGACVLYVAIDFYLHLYLLLGVSLILLVIDIQGWLNR